EERRKIAGKPPLSQGAEGVGRNPKSCAGSGDAGKSSPGPLADSRRSLEHPQVSKPQQRRAPHRRPGARAKPSEGRRAGGEEGASGRRSKSKTTAAASRIPSTRARKVNPRRRPITTRRHGLGLSRTEPR